MVGVHRRKLLKRGAGVLGAAIAAFGSSTAPAKAKPNPKLAQQRERRRVKVVTRTICNEGHYLDAVAQYETDIWHLQHELRTGVRSPFRPERLGE